MNFQVMPKEKSERCRMRKTKGFFIHVNFFSVNFFLKVSVSVDVLLRMQLDFYICLFYGLCFIFTSFSRTCFQSGNARLEIHVFLTLH